MPNTRWSVGATVLSQQYTNQKEEVIHQTSGEEFVSQTVWETEHVNSLNILHNSQINFSPKNRTADHVLTLRTVEDKYMHRHKKIYTQFDWVWHEGLLFKLLQINVGVFSSQ